LGAILVGGAFFGAPSQAQATFTMKLTASNGAGTVSQTVTGTGLIVFAPGAFGDFNSVFVQVATSNSVANMSPAELTIASTNITTTHANASLTITLEDDNFHAPVNVHYLASQLSNTQSPVGVATITYTSFLNGAAGTTLTQTSTSGNVIVNDPVAVPTTPFDLKSVTTIKIHNPSGSSETVLLNGITDASPTPVGGPLPTPAPAGLVLALSGAPFLAFGFRLRRRTQA